MGCYFNDLYDDYTKNNKWNAGVVERKYIEVKIIIKVICFSVWNPLLLLFFLFSCLYEHTYCTPFATFIYSRKMLWNKHSFFFHLFLLPLLFIFQTHTIMRYFCYVLDDAMKMMKNMMVFLFQLYCYLKNLKQNDIQGCEHSSKTSSS